jgi:hypothetical protein
MQEKSDLYVLPFQACHDIEYTKRIWKETQIGNVMFLGEYSKA